MLLDAFSSRLALLDPQHEIALRLFNGFTEGDPRYVVELYGRTALIQDYGDAPIPEIQNALITQFNWLQTIIVKTRQAVDKRGTIIYGTTPDRSIREQGVRYALNLLLNQDSSFYLDTRLVREWALKNLQDKSVLNAFAYTGSLGVAAVAGGARETVHLDLQRKFLNLAKDSYLLNGYPINKQDFIAADFYEAVGQFKRTGKLFDCVFLDPPFFSSTQKGKVDLTESARLINKVRPLINDGGYLVAINNALFVSGADYVRSLETLCADGYLSIEQFIPVSPDCVGYNVMRSLPVDPAPFNHATKIAVLRVRRKEK